MVEIGKQLMMKTSSRGVIVMKYLILMVQEQKQIKYLKMTDNYSMPNHRNYPNKYSNLEELKYIQWGIHQPNTDHLDPETIYIKRNTSPHESEHQNSKKPTHQIPQDANQYFTEESQVSAIQSGFKKMKNNQIQILKELKKEYQVLKNSSLDSRVILNKVTSESQSYDDSNFASQSDAQSSANSKNQNRQRKSDSKQLKLIHLQKKQLELTLSNSMKKIEELLHNQIQLKKNIIQLKSKLDVNKISEAEYDSLLKRAKQNEDLYHKNIEDYKRQNQNLRNKVKDLTVVIGNLQGCVNVKQLQLKKKQERVKVLEQEVSLKHNKYASLELDLKKLKMEYDLLEKSKNQQISLLNKNKNHIEELVINQKNQTIKKLKEQLQIKQERYLILVNKLNSSPHPNSTKQQDKQSVINFQRLIQTIKQQKNQQNNESVALILSKLAQIQAKPDQHLLSQISNLRHELQLIKQSNNSQPQNDRNRLQASQYQSKIRELEQVIEEQNIEKIYFMEDIKKLTKDYNTNKKQKEALSKEIRQLNNTVDRLEQQNRRYKNEIQMIKNINVDLTQSQHQNKNLIVKLQHMNLREIQINNIKEQANKKYDQFRLRQQSYQQEIRIIKKKLVQQELNSMKIHEESELKFRINKIQHQNQINRLLDQLQKAKKNHANDKNDLIRQKIELQKKLLEKSKQFDDHHGKVNSSLKEREEIIEKLKNDQNLILKKQQQNSRAQIAGLLSKIESLNAANTRILQQSQKYAVIEQEMLQLKHLMRMNRRITDAVDHLWQVKQTEYSNINQILNTFK